MAVQIVCPASARPGMMISFHASLMHNSQYQSALYQPFQDTGITNTCNIGNEVRLEGHTLNNSSATNSTAPDIYTKCYKNANTTTTDNDARSSSKVKSDIEIELSSINNNNNRTTAIQHLKSA